MPSACTAARSSPASPRIDSSRPFAMYCRLPRAAEARKAQEMREAELVRMAEDLREAQAKLASAVAMAAGAAEVACPEECHAAEGFGECQNGRCYCALGRGGPSCTFNLERL